jgi:hypothetical protein
MLGTASLAPENRDAPTRVCSVMNERRVQSSLVCVVMAMVACGGDGDAGVAGDSSSGAGPSG